MRYCRDSVCDTLHDDCLDLRCCHIFMYYNISTIACGAYTSSMLDTIQHLFYSFVYPH